MVTKTTLLTGFFLLLFTAFGQAYIRIQTTITGYDIGRLKIQEIDLLKKRSLLTMEVEKLTTQKNLLANLAKNDANLVNNKR